MQSDELRLPPSSQEAEQSLLGSLLIDNSVFERIADILSENDFYRDDHRRIYGDIVRLIEAGKPADVITVFESLERKGVDVGGLAYLGALGRNCPSSASARRYAEIIRDKRIARDLISASVTMHELAYGAGDISSRLEEAQSLIANLHEGSISEEPILLHDVLVKLIEQIDDRQRSGTGEVIGLPSGLADLDVKTAGFQNGDLILIAGRPSMGKSALAMQIAQHTALSGKPVLIFSLEMSDSSLAERMLANHGRINSQYLRTGDLKTDEWERLTKAVGELHEAKLFIDQSSSPSLSKIRAKARRTKRKHGLSLIVVDYIQLMSGDGNNREQEIASISRGLKLLAKELDVPVIALSQLSRRCEERTDKRPNLSDLRESGALEQDADLVIFVYREEVYKPGEEVGIAELLIRKHRMGACGDIALVWRGEFSRFDSYAGNYQRPEKIQQKRGGFNG